MKPKEVSAILQKLGWALIHDGKHDKLVSPDGTIRVALGRHQDKDIPIGTLRDIEKRTGVKLR